MTNTTAANSSSNTSWHHPLSHQQTDNAIVVTDRKGTITDWNPAAMQFFGYSDDEALGNALSVLLPAADREALNSAILNGVARDGFWLGEVPFVRKDGREGVSDTVAFSHHDETTVIVCRDTSENRSLQAAAHDTSERLRLIADNLPATIVYLDAEQRYRFVNKAIE